MTTTNVRYTTRAPFPGALPAGARTARTAVTAAVRQAVRAYGGGAQVRGPAGRRGVPRAGEPA